MQLACNTKIHCFLSLFATRVTTHWLKQLFIAMLASIHPHLEFSMPVWPPGPTKRKTYKESSKVDFVQWDKSTTHMKYRHPYNTCRYTINNQSQTMHSKRSLNKRPGTQIQYVQVLLLAIHLHATQRPLSLTLTLFWKSRL